MFFKIEVLHETTLVTIQGGYFYLLSNIFNQKYTRERYSLKIFVSFFRSRLPTIYRCKIILVLVLPGKPGKFCVCYVLEKLREMNYT